MRETRLLLAALVDDSVGVRACLCSPLSRADDGKVVPQPRSLAVVATVRTTIIPSAPTRPAGFLNIHRIRARNPLIVYYVPRAGPPHYFVLYKKHIDILQMGDPRQVFDSHFFHSEDMVRPTAEG